MRIAIPKETGDGETRVALTPDVAGRLIRKGHEVVVETDAGRLAGFLDSGRYYCRYLAAYNWSAAVAMTLTVLYAGINFTGAASGQEAARLVSPAAARATMASSRP